MHRRLLTILLPAAAVALASCSTFETDVVATVDGVDMTDGDLDEFVGVLPTSTGAPAGGDASAADVRQAINIWIQGRILADALEQSEVEVGDEAVDEATQNLEAQLPAYMELSDENRQLLIDLLTGQTAVAEMLPPASQELVDRYAAGPAQSGLICVSHILVDSVEAAADVKDRLDDGADFAELAASESTDPGSAQEGGDLGCFSVEEFGSTFIPEFVEGALEAELGEPTEPVESQFGAHVILVRTAEQSADGLAALETSPQDFLAGLLESAEISVASRYGTFDLDAGGVVPLG